MKKILLYATIGALCLSGCDLDINQDPDYPDNSSVTAPLLFPAVINAVATVTGDGTFNYAGFFAQYFEQMPEANQYNDITQYNLEQDDQLIDRCYSMVYSRALMDFEDIKKKTENPNDLFALQVIRTFALQMMIDNMGKTPYSEALQGAANAQPKWDDGKAVYEGVLAELDAAEALLTGSPMECAETDPIYKGDVSKWVKYANALRLRMYMRMIDAGESSYEAKVTALVQKNDFPTDDVLYDAYLNQEGQYNPWYSGVYSLGTRNHCAAYPLVSYYLDTDDPRISYAINKNDAGNYFGQFPGAKMSMSTWNGNTDWKNKDVSSINTAVVAAAPVVMFSYSNLQFLLAEVYVRFIKDDAKAKAAYEAAVTSDFQVRGMGTQAAAFLAGDCDWAKATDDTAKLKLIYMQKWVAFFMRDHMEAWSELRRTDVPALSAQKGNEIYANPSIYTPGDLIAPIPNALGDNTMIKRTNYPKTAGQLNPNVPTPDSVKDPVFWDKK